MNLSKLLIAAAIGLLAVATVTYWPQLIGGADKPATMSGLPENGDAATAGTKSDSGSLRVDPKDVAAQPTPSNPKSTNAAEGKRRPIGKTGKAPHGAAVFPDGTWLEPLNGVTVAPPFPGFAPGYPYAPVVEIVKGDKGVSWYIHADGSTSSTQLVETTQEGRKFVQAGWAVGNPTTVLPVDVAGGFGPRVNADPKRLQQGGGKTSN